MSKFLSLSIGLLLSLFCQVTCVEPELSAKIVYQLLSMRIDNVVRENNNLKSELKETKAVVDRLENKIESMEVNISLMASKAARYEEENSKPLLNEKMQAFEKLFASRLQKKFKTEAIVSRKMLTNGKSHMKETIREIEQKFKSFKSELIDNLSAMNTTVDSLENSISKQNITTITMLVAVEDKLKSQLNETNMLIQDMNEDFGSKLRSVSSKQDRLMDTFSDQISALSQRTSEQNITAMSMLEAVRRLSQAESNLQSTYSGLNNRLNSAEGELRLTVSSKQDKQEDKFSGQISALSGRISVEEERKVAFSARMSEADSYYVKKERLVFNDVIYSYGGGYSSSSGIFTAPKSGTYLFSYNIQSTYSGMAHVVLMINGKTRTEVIASGSANGGNLGIDYVYKGQMVWVQTLHFESRYYIEHYRTTFNGILID
ncbi:uncharacterized protein LOC132720003 isoform X1 [Ruditapes philippinarum]|uniref:uncharacterized protein LOC132720003 isoform X1 n=1 Tax=Ruditapes philippinarum TaxID=129788 RepID=UPI00295C16A8|nr:uncharacterized protein LOC132720003 isoform X1 [Ruditapes philippinarum]